MMIIMMMMISTLDPFISFWLSGFLWAPNFRTRLKGWGEVPSGHRFRQFPGDSPVGIEELPLKSEMKEEKGLMTYLGICTVPAVSQ
jgi:hypothetical protein